VQIRYSHAAAKALRRSDKRDLIRAKIDQLAFDPPSVGANVIRLTGRDDFRLRVQNWRVVFRIEDDVLLIDQIQPRGSAYED
jgi:mRNA interferase RelE/StbE